MDDDEPATEYSVDPELKAKLWEIGLDVEFDYRRVPFCDPILLERVFPDRDFADILASIGLSDSGIDFEVCRVVVADFCLKVMNLVPTLAEHNRRILVAPLDIVHAIRMVLGPLPSQAPLLEALTQSLAFPSVLVSLIGDCLRLSGPEDELRELRAKQGHFHRADRLGEAQWADRFIQIDEECSSILLNAAEDYLCKHLTDAPDRRSTRVHVTSGVCVTPFASPLKRRGHPDYNEESPDEVNSTRTMLNLEDSSDAEDYQPHQHHKRQRTEKDNPKEGEGADKAERAGEEKEKQQEEESECSSCDEGDEGEEGLEAEVDEEQVEEEEQAFFRAEEERELEDEEEEAEEEDYERLCEEFR